MGARNRFSVWDAGKDEPALRFAEPEGAEADLSPDGEQIALSRFGRERLVLFKWRTGEKDEVFAAQFARGVFGLLVTRRQALGRVCGHLPSFDFDLRHG